MPFIKKVLRDIRNQYRVCFYKRSGDVRKETDLWVFGAWQGKMYADNSKYLFRYMNLKHPEIRCVWVSNDLQTVIQVRKEGNEAYLINGIKGINLIMRAGVVFMTEGNNDVGSHLIRNSLQIQLWHGVGIKDVKKFQKGNYTNIRENDYSALAYAHKEDYWMTACQEAVKKYSEAYGIDSERMFITGQPKDDTFINNLYNETIREIRKSHPQCKIVAYLPTHRNFGKSGSNNEVLSYDTLLQVNEMLAEQNIVMIFKPHFHEFKNYKGKNINMSNLFFATNPQKYGDVYEFLPACDGLITDYSGIMLGYLTSGKPIIYFPYDKDIYMTDDAGFCYSYEEVTAGPLCYTWDEVVRETAKIFEQDEYVEQRERLRQRFSPFNDGNNSERVYQQVIRLLENRRNER